jgi:hypothetical protein
VCSVQKPNTDEFFPSSGRTIQDGTTSLKSRCRVCENEYFKKRWAGLPKANLKRGRKSAVVGEIRTCSKCNKEKPNTLEFFRRGSGTPIGSVCKDCLAVYHQETYVYTPELAAKRKKYCDANKDRSRDYHRMRNYGVSPEQYDEMLKRQGGVCAICHSAPKVRPKHTILVIDHNHTTGRVRALLCHRCNVVIGMVSESTLLMDNMAQYIINNNTIDNGVQS